MGKPSNTKDTSKQNKKVWPSIKLSDLHKRSALHLSMGERWRSRRNWPPNFKSRWSPSLLKVNKDNRVSQIRFPGTTLGTRCSLNSCSLAMLVKADVQTRAKPGVYFTTLKLVCRASNFFFPLKKAAEIPLPTRSKATICEWVQLCPDQQNTSTQPTVHLPGSCVIYLFGTSTLPG